MGERFLPGSSHRNWSELGEFAEIMDCCCEVELDLGRLAPPYLRHISALMFKLKR